MYLRQLHLHFQCVDWRQSCKLTHPVKCSLDLRKDKKRDGWIWTQPRLLRIPGWNTHRAHGFQTWQTGALSVCMSRTQHVWYLMWTTLLSVSSQRRLKNSGPTKLVVIKRREAISPRIPVTCLGFEYRRVHDGDRRGFTVKNYWQVRGRMLGHFSTAESKGREDAIDRTEEFESAR